MRTALLITMPTIVKARESEGRRLVELEVSNEEKDAENDVILQSALLGSSASFLRSGHFDIDHISEIGDRVGIPNPASYIVGRPTKVLDLGEGRTGCECQIFRSRDGVHDAKKHKYDELWDSLNTDPPVKWLASIYGFPLDGMVDNCTEKVCDKGATRYLVKGIDWRSVAFTRHPVNTAITHAAKIVTEKAYMEAIKCGDMPLSQTASAGTDVPMPYALAIPKSMDELVGHYHRHMQSSPYSMGLNNTVAYREHFVMACGCDPHHAELLASALMYHYLNTLVGVGG